MVRNFNRFEVNHWYVYTGTERPCNWNREGAMDEVLNHTAVMCSEIGTPFSAKLGKMTMWHWQDGFDNWIEVRNPSDRSPVTSSDYLYLVQTNTLVHVSPVSSDLYKNYYVLTRPPFDMEELKDKSKNSTTVGGYKIGDKVLLKTKEELINELGFEEKNINHYSCLKSGTDAIITGNMCSFLGKAVTIKSFIPRNDKYNIKIEECSGSWNTDWISSKCIVVRIIDEIHHEELSGKPCTIPTIFDLECLELETLKSLSTHLSVVGMPSCDVHLADVKDSLNIMDCCDRIIGIHYVYTIHKRNKTRKYKMGF